MFAGVRAAVSSRSRANTGTNAGKGKKKGKKGGKAAQSTLQAAEKTQPKSSAQQSWGPLEPVRPILEPLADLVRPLLTGNVMYGLLVGLLVAAWFGFGSSRGAPNGYPNGHNGPGPYSFARGPDRMAAYEEMWRREDSNLWEWLEERTGMDRLHTAGASGAPTRPPVRARPRKSSAGPDMRQLEEALRVTQQKLRILEEAIGHEPVDVKV